MYVIKLIQAQEKEFFIFDFLNITLNWNTGIAFGLLSFNANTIYHLIFCLNFADNYLFNIFNGFERQLWEIDDFLYYRRSNRKLI